MGPRFRDGELCERQESVGVARQQLDTEWTSMPEITAHEIQAIARELNAYVELHPSKREARALAIRCRRDRCVGRGAISPATDRTELGRN